VVEATLSWLRAAGRTQDAPLLLAALLPHLHQHPRELLAVQHGEWDLAYQAATGMHLPPALFAHLLRSGPMASGDAAAPAPPPAGPAPTPAPAGAASISWRSSSQVAQSLTQLAAVLGPELAHAALSSTPALLEVPADELRARLSWLQRQLR
jgi:hypothetical protein